MSLQDLLRRLPGLDALLQREPSRRASDRHGRRLVAAQLRRRLDLLRKRVRTERPSSGDVDAAAEALAAEAAAALDEQARGRLLPVWNATGVLVHTNLGRAPLGALARERLAQRAGVGVSLELDLRTGKRGRRAPGCDELLVELTGAEAACVVNNCAASLLLALNALSMGRSVVVSRGELVEIGGSFRIPDVCERAGVVLHEVGTTNRTRAADYRGAFDGASDPPALLLKVHPSNFRVVGFTEETTLAELVALGRERGVPVVMDQGSGALEDLSPWGIEGELPVPEAVRAGADLVLFSADKLLGGPQGGCIVGRREAVEACRANPLFRALRPDKLTLLALEATLWAHASGRLEDVPVQRQLRLPVEEVRGRAETVLSRLEQGRPEADLALEEGASTSGGGSSPTSHIPTWLLTVRPRVRSANSVAVELRRRCPRVLARVADDAVVLDLRTVPPEGDDDVVRALSRALGADGSPATAR